MKFHPVLCPWKMSFGHILEKSTFAPTLEEILPTPTHNDSFERTRPRHVHCALHKQSAHRQCNHWKHVMQETCCAGMGLVVSCKNFIFVVVVSKRCKMWWKWRNLSKMKTLRQSRVFFNVRLRNFADSDTLQIPFVNRCATSYWLKKLLTKEKMVSLAPSFVVKTQHSLTAIHCQKRFLNK